MQVADEPNQRVKNITRARCKHRLEEVARLARSSPLVLREYGVRTTRCTACVPASRDILLQIPLICQKARCWSRRRSIPGLSFTNMLYLRRLRRHVSGPKFRFSRIGGCETLLSFNVVFYPRLRQRPRRIPGLSFKFSINNSSNSLLSRSRAVLLRTQRQRPIISTPELRLRSSQIKSPHPLLPSLSAISLRARVRLSTR